MAPADGDPPWVPVLFEVTADCREREHDIAHGRIGGHLMLALGRQQANDEQITDSVELQPAPANW